MATKTFNARFQFKGDTLANWQAANPVLLDKELAIVIVPAESGAVAQEPAVLFKVGNGTTAFNDLPFVSAKAADVYDWAKAASKPSYTADEISGLADYIAGEIEDTDTQYKLEQDATDGHILKLSSKAKNATEWAIVATITTVDTVYDDTALSGKVTSLEGLVGETAVATQIANAISALKLAETYATKDEVKAVSDKIGIVAEGKTVVQMISDAQTAATYDDTALAGRVTTLEGDKTKEGSVDNKIDTAVKGLKVDAVTAGTGEVISEVSEANGVVSVSKKTLAAEDIPTLTTAKLSDFGTEMAKKQDVVAFEGAYDKETNKAATMADVNGAVAGLQGAMHYRGDSSTDPMGISGPTVEGYAEAWLAGDVVTYQTEEFLYTGSAWRPYGKEGDYAIKGSIKDSDIAADAAIAQSKIAGLTDVLAGKADTTALHSHDNKTVLDGITTEKVTAWDTVNAKANDADLAAIAKSGNVNDLAQTAGDMIVFNCGTATAVI